MATIREIIQGRPIYAAQSSDTILNAARAMVEHNVGAVPVLDGKQLVGVFSERDIMKRVLVERRDPSATTVGDVMSADPLVVGPDERVDNCLALMKQHGFRHLPVWDGHELQGFISMRDLLACDLDEKHDEVRMMRAYMHSTPGE
jgi:CBS domain-containing protein